MSMLAIGWEPELRGLLTVVMGTVVLMGSVYMVMATNMGSRLAFLVALTGLAGWMVLMGITWWIYGIGLRGPDPSWAPVQGQTVLQDVRALESSGALEGPLPDIPEGDFVASSEIVGEQFIEEGYIRIASSDPSFGQAQTAASAYLEEEEAFAAGQFVITDIFDIGGERYPKIANENALDFFAFFHEPHYVVAEAAALEQVRDEPGRAPAIAGIDDTRQRQYVYMVRDLGARRQPATTLTIGGGAIFLALCYLLHRRERILRENVSGSVAKA